MGDETERTDETVIAESEQDMTNSVPSIISELGKSVRRTDRLSMVMTVVMVCGYILIGWMCIESIRKDRRSLSDE